MHHARHIGFHKYRVVCALIASAALSSGGTLRAQVNQSDIAQVGLDVAWRAQIIQGQEAGVPVSATLFPHPTKRKQSLTIVSNGRVIEHISGDAIDRAAYEQQLVKIDTKEETKITIPKIGLAGARLLADKTEARLKLLGRKSERIEIDREMIYLVTASLDGSIQAFDAETGESLWTASVGQSNRPTMPAGVSDEYVSVINGPELYLLRLSDGTTVNTRKLESGNSISSLPVGSWIFVPAFEGTLTAYNATKKDALPWRSVSGGTSTEMPVLSLDRKFIAWNSAPKFLNITRIDDRTPTSWNRFESSEPVRTQPIAVQNGYIVATGDGGITRLGLPSDESNGVRNNAILWRSSSGIYNPSTPIVANGLVLVWSLNSGLTALNEKTGEIVWPEINTGIGQVISISASSIYCRSKEGRLLVLDSKTGEVQRSIPKTIPTAISNSINDRLYFINQSGQIICLRELNALRPVSLLAPSAGGPPSKSAPKTPAGEPIEETKPAQELDPFGGGLPSTENAPAMNAPATTADPFGGSAGDPFGGSPTEAPKGSSGSGGTTVDPNDPFGGN